MLTTALASSWSVFARGLLYPGSEGDSPYRAFSAALDGGEPPTEAGLRAALRLASWWQIELGDADAWFAETIAWAQDPGGGDAPDDAARYTLLQKLMHAATSEPLVRIGIVAPADAPRFHRARRIACARLADGSLAGLIALSVET